MYFYVKFYGIKFPDRVQLKKKIYYIKRNYMLYSEDLTLKSFVLESRAFSFQVMFTNEYLDLVKFSM